MSTRRLALAGAVGPVLWVVIVLALTVLEWDYLRGRGWDPVRASEVAYPSSTALGDYGWLQILNFLQLGVAVLALCLGLWRTIAPRPTAALRLLGVVGVAILLSAFPTDGSANSVTTWHGAIHAVAFLVFYLGSIAAALLMWRRLRRNAEWASQGRNSLTAVISVIALTVLSLIPPVGGLATSLLILTILVWIEFLALRLLAIARDEAGT